MNKEEEKKITYITKKKPSIVLEYIEGIEVLFLIEHQSEKFIYYLSEKSNKEISYRVNIINQEEFDKLRLKEINLKNVYEGKETYKVTLSMTKNDKFILIENEIIKIEKSVTPKNELPSNNYYFNII